MSWGACGAVGRAWPAPPAPDGRPRPRHACRPPGLPAAPPLHPLLAAALHGLASSPCGRTALAAAAPTVAGQLAAAAAAAVAAGRPDLHRAACAAAADLAAVVPCAAVNARAMQVGEGWEKSCDCRKGSVGLPSRTDGLDIIGMHAEGLGEGEGKGDVALKVGRGGAKAVTRRAVQPRLFCVRSGLA
jgi:hypothetical protein